MDNRAFAYGGKHFVPVRKFEKRDGDFYQITRRLKRDLEFGFFRADCYGVVLQIKRVVNPQIVLASRRADEDFAPHYQRTVLPITGTKIPPCKLTAQRYFVLSDQNGSSSSPVW